jgi:hypothetical protein
MCHRYPWKPGINLSQRPSPRVEHARLGFAFVDCGRSACCDGRIGRLSGVASLPSIRVRRPAFHSIRLTLAVSLTRPSVDVSSGPLSNRTVLRVAITPCR